MKICSVAAARPNFVKLAAVHQAILKTDHEHVIVHTGQHYDPLFSDIFFKQLDIALPQFNLGVHGDSRDDVIEKTEQAFAKILSEIQPDLVLVYGDVNGALGAALASQKAGIRIAHIEAGLRSSDTSMPEEHNRIGIDRIADILFVTEQSGMDHLKKEKVKGKAIFVGNTMIDTLVRMLPIIEKEELPLKLPSSFAVVTLHRPSNVDDKESLEHSLEFLNDISNFLPVVFPVHLRTRKNIDTFGLKDSISKDVLCIDPLGYIPFLKLVKKSSFVLTDSGGIQEEATFLKKRCFTLRKNTERPSTIKSGSNVLIDPDDEKQKEEVIAFAKNPAAPAVTIPPLWDGRAGERILQALQEL